MSGSQDSWSTFERVYSSSHDHFMKRSLAPSEYRRNIHGQLYVPVAGKERLENEAASLRFIKSQTNIPVPTVLDAYEQDGSYYLWTELLPDVPIKELSESDQKVVLDELEIHLHILSCLQSDRIGGPAGIIYPPNSVTMHFPRDKKWPLIHSLHKEFVFCHNDLSQSNIMVDPVTLKISGIIDWEFAGYYLSFFESPFYKGSRSSGSQMRNLPNIFHFVEFFSVYLP